MTAGGQVKAALIGRLTDAGVVAVGAFSEERLHRYSESVVAVGARETKIDRSGLLDYLGERQNGRGGVAEVYGRKLAMTFSADVYTPRELGAAAGEETAEQAAQALLSGLPGGLRVDAMCFGRSAWDAVSGMFLLPGSVSCTAFFEAEAEPESTVLREFILRGVLSE